MKRKVLLQLLPKSGEREQLPSLPMSHFLRLCLWQARLLGRKFQFTVFQPSERRCQLFCSDTIQIVTMCCMVAARQRRWRRQRLVTALHRLGCTPSPQRHRRRRRRLPRRCCWKHCSPKLVNQHFTIMILKYVSTGWLQLKVHALQRRYNHYLCNNVIALEYCSSKSVLQLVYVSMCPINCHKLKTRNIRNIHFWEKVTRWSTELDEKDPNYLSNNLPHKQYPINPKTYLN